MRLNFVMVLAILSVCCKSQDVATFGEFVRFSGGEPSVSASHLGQWDGWWKVTGFRNGSFCNDLFEAGSLKVRATRRTTEVKGVCKTCTQTFDYDPTCSEEECEFDNPGIWDCTKILLDKTRNYRQQLINSKSLSELVLGQKICKTDDDGENEKCKTPAIVLERSSI